MDVNANAWLPSFRNGIAPVPNDKDNVHNFLSSSLVPDLGAIAKRFMIGAVGNKRTLVFKVLMFLYKSERHGGRNWPELEGAKYVD